jgi:hypothetical protein
LMRGACRMVVHQRHAICLTHKALMHHTTQQGLMQHNHEVSSAGCSAHLMCWLNLCYPPFTRRRWDRAGRCVCLIPIVVQALHATCLHATTAELAAVTIVSNFPVVYHCRKHRWHCFLYVHSPDGAPCGGWEHQIGVSLQCACQKATQRRVSCKQRCGAWQPQPAACLGLRDDAGVADNDVWRRCQERIDCC